MFSTIQSFITSVITDTVTLKSMNIMGYANQYIFRTEKACKMLKFIESTKLSATEIGKYIGLVDTERENTEEKLEEIRVAHFREGKLFSQILKEKLGGE